MQQSEWHIRYMRAGIFGSLRRSHHDVPFNALLLFDTAPIANRNVLEEQVGPTLEVDLAPRVHQEGEGGRQRREGVEGEEEEEAARQEEEQGRGRRRRGRSERGSSHHRRRRQSLRRGRP